MALEVNYERLQRASWSTYRMDWLAGLRWAYQLPGAEIGAIIQNITGTTMPELGGSFGPTSLGMDIEDILVTALSSHALYLPGTSGSFISTPDALALDITGDIDMRIEYALSTVSAVTHGLMAKWGAAGQRSYSLEHGQLFDVATMITSNDGTASVSSGVGLSSLPQQPGALRVTLDVDNGATGKTWVAYTAPTLDGPWVQFNTSTTATVTSIFASTAVLVLGATDSAGTTNMFKGRIARAELRAGIDGTVVANPDFRNLSPGTTSFADGTGKTWTLQGNAVII